MVYESESMVDFKQPVPGWEKDMQKRVYTSLFIMFSFSAAIQAAEIGLGVPGTSIYYQDKTAGKTEYRIATTLGSPMTLSGHYRAQIRQIDNLFWEAGLSVSSGGGNGSSDVPLSLGYRFQIEKRFAIEPILTITPLAGDSGFGVNIAYRL